LFASINFIAFGQSPFINHH